jgi:hypothetical protein
MATIPQAIDYGARPSLRSDRVDLPGEGETAISDAVAAAANTFADVMIDRKVKQDKFNYNMAKQEYLTAELQEREKLKGDEEFDTYDERYRTGTKARREEIRKKWKLTPNDGVIFDAEADLITERGAAAVAEYGRVKMVDFKRANLIDALADARNNIVSAEPFTRNDQIMTTLELISAGVEEGWLPDTEGANMRKAFGKDVARGSLTSMEREDAIDLINKSLAHRTGGPISIEDIKAGRGTGSVADFLHEDELVELRDKLEAGDKISKDRIAAQAVEDEAWELYEDPKKRMDHVRDNLEGDQRAIGVTSARQRNAEEAAQKQQYRDSLMTHWGNEIAQRGIAYSDIPAEVLEELTPPDQALLQKWVENQAEREGYGEFDDDETYYKWRREMTDQEKADAELMSMEWKGLFTRERHERLVDEQALIATALEQGKPPPSYKGDTDDEYLTNVLLGSESGFDNRPTPGSDDYDRWARIDRAYDDALKDESMKKVRAGKDGDLDADERRKILSDVLKEQVFLRVDPWGPDVVRTWWNKDAARQLAYVAELTPEQKKLAFLPYSEAAKDFEPDGLGGQTTVLERLKGWAKSMEVEPSRADYEEAYYYYKYGPPESNEEMAKARLRGEEGY